MPDRTLPARELDLVDFARTFADGLSRDPAAYGMNDADVAAVRADAAAFEKLLVRARANLTRTPVVIRAKEAARGRLLATLRSCIRRARAAARAAAASPPGETKKDSWEVGDVAGVGGLVVLGVRPRASARREVPVADTPPRVTVLCCDYEGVHVRVTGRNSPRGGKPAGADLALLLLVPGPGWPTDDVVSRLPFTTTVQRAIVPWPADVKTGDSAWVAARWATLRGAEGPLSQFELVHRTARRSVGTLYGAG